LVRPSARDRHGARRPPRSRTPRRSPGHGPACGAQSLGVGLGFVAQWIARRSDQEGTAYKGHVGCACYHPRFVFNQFGNLQRCALRAANVHSVDGWKAVHKPVVARCRGQLMHDAAHIIADKDKDLGQPIVPNGIPLSKKSTR